MRIEDIRRSPDLAKKKYDEARDRIRYLNKSIHNKNNEIYRVRKIIKSMEEELTELRKSELQRAERRRAIMIDRCFNIAVECVSDFYPYINAASIKSRSRKRELVDPRQIIASLLLDKYTSIKCGIVIGGRDHSTVLHSRKAVIDRCSIDKDFRAKYDQIEKKFKRLV